MSLKTIKKHLTGASAAVAHGDTERAQHLLGLASEAVEALLRDEVIPAAAKLGALGGAQTAKRGPDYFRELASRRKTHGGGRPRKEAV